VLPEAAQTVFLQNVAQQVQCNSSSAQIWQGLQTYIFAYPALFFLACPRVLCDCAVHRYDFQFEKQSAANLPLPGIECSMTGAAAAAALEAAGSQQHLGLSLPRLTAAQRQSLRQQQQQLAQV
jgi:hypothetical protein